MDHRDRGASLVTDDVKLTSIMTVNEPQIAEMMICLYVDVA